MKSVLLFILFSGFISFTSAQSVSCEDLVEYAMSKDSYPDTVRPYDSSFLVKAEYYYVAYSSGLVIAYIKTNDWDYRGKPYIFCGISQSRWNTFKSEGMYSGSYGKAFHTYIMDYTCDCY